MDGIIILAIIFFVLKRVLGNKKIDWKTLAGNLDDSDTIKRVLSTAHTADGAGATVTTVKTAPPANRPTLAFSNPKIEPMHGQEMQRAPLRTTEYQPLVARVGPIGMDSGSLGAYNAEGGSLGSYHTEGSSSAEGTQSMEGQSSADIAQWDLDRDENEANRLEGQAGSAPFALRLDGDALVQAIVMKEILQRPRR